MIVAPTSTTRCKRPSPALNTKTHAGTFGVRGEVWPSRLTTATKGSASPTDKPSLLFEWLSLVPLAFKVDSEGRVLARVTT